MNVKPIRVLQVVSSMNRGGVETWLMHVLRNIDRTRFHFDFMVHDPRPGGYDGELQTLGAAIIHGPPPGKPLVYARTFRQLIDLHGPYDVVHSHIHHFTGWVLWQSAASNIPLRIAHSHNDTSIAESSASFVRQLYLTAMRYALKQRATHCIAASAEAAQNLFGPNWRDDSRVQVVHCGIDLTPFAPVHRENSLRHQLGIPQDASVMGHIGRFAPQKNHELLLEIASAVIQQESGVHLVLVGTGPLEPEIRRKSTAMGIGDHVHFLGVRTDVPQLMLDVMDCMVLPSLHEGLPIVGLEAQAAGLPIVMADNITSEMDVAPELITRISLTSTLSMWVQAILFHMHSPKPEQRVFFEQMSNSDFNIVSNIDALVSLYTSFSQDKDQ